MVYHSTNFRAVWSILRLTITIFTFSHYPDIFSALPPSMAYRFPPKSHKMLCPHQLLAALTLVALAGLYWSLIENFQFWTTTLSGPLDLFPLGLLAPLCSISIIIPWITWKLLTFFSVPTVHHAAGNSQGGSTSCTAIGNSQGDPGRLVSIGANLWARVMDLLSGKANFSSTASPGNFFMEFAGNASASAFSTSTHSGSGCWIADTGASSHMTPNCHWFNDYKPCRIPVHLADNNIIYASGVGSIIFDPVENGKSLPRVEFHNVLHVPLLASNLLSVLHLTRKKGFEVHIKKSTMLFHHDSQLWFQATVGDDNCALLNGSTLVQASA